MLWWAAAVMDFIIFMALSFYGMYFFGQAMSLANPNQPLPFRTTINSPYLKKVYESKDPNVKKYLRKYEISFGCSIVAMLALAFCFLNAPHVKITH
jgi:hypothetical protein